MCVADLLNNLGDDLWNNRTVRPFLRAARQVFFEYQYALDRDAPIDDAALERCANAGRSQLKSENETNCIR